jgi:uncharacterized damage-inducible protein DinB
MTPQEAKTIADFLIADIEYEMQATMAVLGAVPAAGSKYQPDAKSKTGLGLCRHLALEDAWLLNAVADGAFTSAPPDDSDACGIMTPADAVERYKKDMPPALARVRAMSGDQLLKVIDLMGMVQLPAVNMLSMFGKHTVHHRGQLSAYLRAMGGKVPGIYGPTADMQ